MASADWMKLTSPHAAGMKKHLGAEERLSVNHSNRDIDKSKSHLNIVIGCEDYADALAAMRARVKEIDKRYPPLKKKKADERVIAEMIEVKCPQEIVEKGYEAVCEYFRGVYKIQQDFFGAENVHGGFAHFDEIHTYTDKDGTKRDSLPHMHTLVSAYCEWEEPVKVKGKKTGEFRHRQGINGKHFEVKPRYNQLNGKIDEYCMKYHGITYTKGKGKEPGHGKTVETLKAEEKLHQITAQTNAAMQQRIREQELTEQARQQREANEQASAEALAEADKAEQERRENAKKNTELQQRQSTLLHNVGTLEQREKYLAENVESLVKNEEGCRRTIDNLEEKITSLTASQEALTDTVEGLQQKADSLYAEATEAEQRAKTARSELSGIITQTEQQKSELAEIQDKVLGYKTAEKKHFGESQAAYHDRIATAQQAAAIAQRTEELDERETKLNARDAEQDSREKNIAWKEKNIDAIAQSRAEKLAAKPLAQAKAIIKEERTAHAATKAELSSTRAALHKVLGKLRDTFLAAFAPHRNQHNAHEKQARELRRGEDHGTLQRRNGYQSQTKEKSQSKGQPGLHHHR